MSDESANETSEIVIEETPTFDIHNAFLNKERELRARFLAIRNVTSHPVVRGDQSEADWVEILRNFLPNRYSVGPIFAVDHHGSMSEQIDVAVYDGHFSPQWFGGAHGVRFVPVESVYAVFESKPELNAKYVKAAIQKVASVRALERTSQTIVHVGGSYVKPVRDRKPILGGIVATRNGWPNTPEKFLLEYQPSDPKDPGFLNIGIALDGFCFDYTPTLGDEEQVTVPLTFSENGQQLIHFVIRLFRQLQAIGSVPAVEMDKYEEAIRKSGGAASQPTPPMQ